MVADKPACACRGTLVSAGAVHGEEECSYKSPSGRSEFGVSKQPPVFKLPPAAPSSPEGTVPEGAMWRAKHAKGMFYKWENGNSWFSCRSLPKWQESDRGYWTRAEFDDLENFEPLKPLSTPKEEGWIAIEADSVLPDLNAEGFEFRREKGAPLLITTTGYRVWQYKHSLGWRFYRRRIPKQG